MNYDNVHSEANSSQDYKLALTPSRPNTLAGRARCRRVHPGVFQYFHQFTAERRYVLLDLIDVVFCDSLVLRLPLFHCHVASHQVPHDVLQWKYLSPVTCLKDRRKYYTGITMGDTLSFWYTHLFICMQSYLLKDNII